MVPTCRYAQCLSEARRERNIETQGWDGEIMACGDTTMISRPPSASRRSLLQDGGYGAYGGDRGMDGGYGAYSGDRGIDGGYGAYGSDRGMDGGYGAYGGDRGMDGGYGAYGGDRGMDGGYSGDRGFDPAAGASGSTSEDVPAGAECTECLPVYQQCAGGMLEASVCCQEGLNCVVKNPFYAQCLTPGSISSFFAHCLCGTFLRLQHLLQEDFSSASLIASTRILMFGF